MSDDLIIPTHYSIVVERRLLVGDHHYLLDPVCHSGLREAGVTDIFDCMDAAEELTIFSKPAYLPPTFALGHRHNFRTSDDGQRKPPAYWRSIITEASHVLSNPLATIYVHCWAGINRGPAAGYAILRGVMGYSTSSAVETITLARPELGMAYFEDVERALKEMRR